MGAGGVGLTCVGRTRRGGRWAPFARGCGGFGGALVGAGGVRRLPLGWLTSGCLYPAEEFGGRSGAASASVGFLDANVPKDALVELAWSLPKWFIIHLFT